LTTLNAGRWNIRHAFSRGDPRRIIRSCARLVAVPDIENWRIGKYPITAFIRPTFL